MTKTDLSLILSAAGLATGLGAGPLACALLAAYLLGLLTRRRTRSGQ